MAESSGGLARYGAGISVEDAFRHGTAKADAAREAAEAEARTVGLDMSGGIIQLTMEIVNEDAHDPRLPRALSILMGADRLTDANRSAMLKSLVGSMTPVQLLKLVEDRHLKAEEFAEIVKWAKSKGILPDVAIDALVVAFVKAIEKPVKEKFAYLFPKPATATMTKMIPVLDEDDNEVRKVDLGSSELEDDMRNFGYVVRYSKTHRGLVLQKPKPTRSSDDSGGAPGADGSLFWPSGSGSPAGWPAPAATGGPTGTGPMPPVLRDTVAPAPAGSKARVADPAPARRFDGNF